MKKNNLSNDPTEVLDNQVESEFDAEKQNKVADIIIEIQEEEEEDFEF